MTDTFNLHPRLQADTVLLGRFPLCRLLLMNNREFPWCILVPERENISELHQLAATEQVQFITESSVLSAFMLEKFNGDKINIAAIGNLVPQLHIHHIVRYKNDRLWPEPIWGKTQSDPYGKQQLTDLQQLFGEMTNGGFLSDF